MSSLINSEVVVLQLVVQSLYRERMMRHRLNFVAI